MEQLREVLLSRIGHIPFLNNILSITGDACQKALSAHLIFKFETMAVCQSVQQLRGNLIRFAGDLVHIFDNNNIDVRPPANDPHDRLPPI